MRHDLLGMWNGVYDGPDSGRAQKYWKTWSQAISKTLVANQESAGCAKGSWGADDRWGFEGGRVYATAINALTLEAYYRLPGSPATWK